MNKLLIVMVLSVALSLYACCKSECIRDGAVTVSFQNFRHRDVDTVLLVRYAKGGNQALDSAWRYTPATSADTAYARLNILLPGDTDWQVYLPPLSKRTYITGIEVASTKCDCERGKAFFVRQFKVNGTPVQGSLLLLN